MTIKFELLKVRKMTSLKIYISQVMEKLETSKHQHQVKLIQRIQLGPLPQEVVMSLSHNNITLTSLFISNYRGDTVIKFGL